MVWLWGGWSAGHDGQHRATFTPLCVFASGVLPGVCCRQVFEFVLYDSWEPKLVHRYPAATWLHTEHRNAEGRRLLVPSRLCMVLVR